MSAQIFIHPTALSCPYLIERIERETGRRGMWVDGRRAELEPVEWLDQSDYVGEPEWNNGGNAA